MRLPYSVIFWLFKDRISFKSSVYFSSFLICWFLLIESCSFCCFRSQICCFWKSIWFWLRTSWFFSPESSDFSP